MESNFENQVDTKSFLVAELGHSPRLGKSHGQRCRASIAPTRITTNHYIYTNPLGRVA
jgi:hypothetical protein